MNGRQGRIQLHIEREGSLNVLLRLEHLVAVEAHHAERPAHVKPNASIFRQKSPVLSPVLARFVVSYPRTTAVIQGD